MISLNLIKQWLRIEWDDENELLEMLISSANSHLLSSGCFIPTENDKEYGTYKLAVLMLVSHWYNNRTGVDDMNDILSKPLTFGIQDAILKLKNYSTGGGDDGQESAGQSQESTD